MKAETKKYIKEYFRIGAMFAGLGPVVAGIIFMIIHLSGGEVKLSGTQIMIAILSTYVLAFVQAASSVFNRIESWPIAKSLLFHFGSIYLVYLFTYIINSWIPFNLLVIGIFTAIFVLTYFVIWITVSIIVNQTRKKLNEKVKINRETQPETVN